LLGLISDTNSVSQKSPTAPLIISLNIFKTACKFWIYFKADVLLHTELCHSFWNHVFGCVHSLQWVCCGCDLLKLRILISGSFLFLLIKSMVF